ncbi:MAG: hypothetical protein ABIH18_01170 [Candidatus Omnitrophota bacterium]
MKNILFLILILRPLIDLAWDKYLLGFNPANFIGILLFFAVIIILIFKNKTLFFPKSFILFLPAVIISNVMFNRYLYDYASFFRLVSPMIFLFYFWKDETSLKKIEVFMKWFIVISIIPILISYLQYIGIFSYTYWDWLPVIGKMGRASGGYKHPTSLNRILIFTIVFSLYFIHTGKKMWPYMLYLMLALLSVFISYHRSAYFIILIIFILWYINLFKNFKRKWSAMIILSIIVLLVVLIIVKFSTIKLSHVVNYSTLSGLHGRDIKFNRILSLYQELPLIRQLFGNGSGIYYNNYRFQFLDNDFLNYLWRYGIVGLFTWFLVLFEFFSSTFTLKKANLKDYLFNKMTRIVLVCYVLFGMVVEASFLPNFMYIIYSVYAMNIRNISFKYKDSGLKKMDYKLVACCIFAIAVLCCLFYCWVISADFQHMPSVGF